MISTTCSLLNCSSSEFSFVHGVISTCFAVVTLVEILRENKILFADSATPTQYIYICSGVRMLLVIKLSLADAELFWMCSMLILSVLILSRMSWYKSCLCISRFSCCILFNLREILSSIRLYSFLDALECFVEVIVNFYILIQVIYGDMVARINNFERLFYILSVIVVHSSKQPFHCCT